MMTGIEIDDRALCAAAAGAEAMIAGQAQMMFEPMSAAIEPIRRGKLRALAVTTAARSAALPDVPTVGEPCRATRRAP